LWQPEETENGGRPGEAGGQGENDTAILQSSTKHAGHPACSIVSAVPPFQGSIPIPLPGLATRPLGTGVHDAWRICPGRRQLDNRDGGIMARRGD
jgi:hypothetical protein